MAIQHTLIRIDPARYAVVERELLALAADSANELAALYKACDAPLREVVVEAFLRAWESADSAKRKFRAETLAHLVAERAWDLDKTLPQLAEICYALTELAPLASFFDLAACDLRIDKGCRGDDYSGLIALWSAESLVSYLPSVRAYAQSDSARALADSAKPATCEAVDRWTESYVWTAWEQLSDAMHEVVAEEHWLGCVVL